MRSPTPRATPDELAQRIQQLDAGSAARARMAATGHAEVRPKYAVPVIMDQRERHLKQCLAP